MSNDENKEYKFETTMSDGKVNRYSVYGDASRNQALHMEEQTSTVKRVKINGKVEFRR